jgi:tetratricopeptide (TPR) repeat protein
VAGIVFAASVSAQTSQVVVDPWEALVVSTGGSLATNAEAWTQRRAELGLGNTALPVMSMPPDARADAISRLHEAGLLGAERSLLASGRDAGLVSSYRAARWDAVLRDVESELLGGDELVRRVTAIDLAERGALASLLPEQCIALGGAEREALDAYVALDLRTPYWRLRSPMEVEASPTPWPSQFAPALRVAIELLEAVPVSSTFVASADVCSGDVAALFASLAHVDAVQWEQLEPALLTVAAVTAVPDLAWVRPAISAYTRGDMRALQTLSELSVAGESGSYIAALVVAGQDNDGARELALAALPVATAAWHLWVRGELARRSGRYDEALRELGAAVDGDPYFAPALISRASALAAAGRAHDALADLHHLRLTYAGATPYATLIDALDRRLR